MFETKIEILDLARRDFTHIKIISFFFSYKNITNKLKREWYNFQVGTNEFLTEIFGEDEEEENEISNKIDDEDET